jgi:hypothetical protein
MNFMESVPRLRSIAILPRAALRADESYSTGAAGGTAAPFG